MALASRLAAQIRGAYPDLWPETVRALLVHSAEWTPAMKRMFLQGRRLPSKLDYENLVRRCGFGVPDINRALWSVENSLTMVVQETLQPFKRVPGKQVTLRDMHLHNLPWPRDVLESLGDTQVELRVTLSYFIEPNPSQRGTRSRYRYESHGLRFDVRRPLESTDDFRRRINLLARDEETGGNRGGDDPSWLIGGRRTPSRFVARRHLEGHCRGPRESRFHRSLSHRRLVEDSTCAGAVRQSGPVCLGCEHQGAGRWM